MKARPFLGIVCLVFLSLGCRASGARNTGAQPGGAEDGASGADGSPGDRDGVPGDGSTTDGSLGDGTQADGEPEDASPGDGSPEGDGGRPDGGPDAMPDAEVPEHDGGTDERDGSVAPSHVGFCTDMRVVRDGAIAWGRNETLVRGDIVIRTSAADPSFGRYAVLYRRGNGTVERAQVDAADVEDTCPADTYFAYYVLAEATMFEGATELCRLMPGTVLRPRRATENGDGWVRFEFDAPPPGCSATAGSVQDDFVAYVLAHPSATEEIPVITPLRRGQPGTGTFDSRCGLRDDALTLDGLDVVHGRGDVDVLAALRDARDSGLCTPGNRLGVDGAGYVSQDGRPLVHLSEGAARLEGLTQLARAGLGDADNTCTTGSYRQLFAHGEFLVQARDYGAGMVDGLVRLSRAGLCTRITRIHNTLGYLSLDGWDLMPYDSSEALLNDMVTLAESGAAEPGGACSIAPYCIQIRGACAVSWREPREAFDKLVELGRLGSCAP